MCPRLHWKHEPALDFQQRDSKDLVLFTAAKPHRATLYPVQCTGGHLKWQAPVTALQAMP